MPKLRTAVVLAVVLLTTTNLRSQPTGPFAPLVREAIAYANGLRPRGELPADAGGSAPIEDPANVDRRRAEVGLPPLRDYLEDVKARYFPAARD